ncbi:phage recombination protein Bet [Streptomyces noursei]|uniref:phage recombination protein Bet n=1 Tax=Streptomyces noursei TaxID=1971 RepID=UPI0036D42884
MALALISPELKKASRPELAVFFHHCVRSGLDPFARQIYMIGRKNKGRDREENPITWTIQTGIDGFRTIAHRAAERTGERISYEDTVYYAADGTTSDVWLADEPPAAVKVTVLRGTSRFPLVARWAEFAPEHWDNKQGKYVVAAMWKQMPAHMLRKCAEAGSLRMAAPQDLSGVYADEEMEQADAEVVAGEAKEASSRLRAAAGLDDAHSEAESNAEVEESGAPTPKKSRPKPATEASTQSEGSKRPRRRTASKRAENKAADGGGGD